MYATFTTNNLTGRPKKLILQTENGADELLLKFLMDAFNTSDGKGSSEIQVSWIDKRGVPHCKIYIPGADEHDKL